MAGRQRRLKSTTWVALIREFFEDKTAAGEFNSLITERNYRLTLEALADDVHDLDPRLIDREDIKRTLARWPNPNTKSVKRAHLVSFFDWMVEEGKREFNPVRQTKRVRRRKPEVTRWTLDEARAFLAAAATVREKRVSVLGVCMGLRLGELIGLRGEDFARPGFISVRGKGGRLRVLPLTDDALEVAEEIRRNVEPGHYVVPAERWRDPNVEPREKKQLLAKPGSRQAVRTVVIDLSKRAGIGHATPHTMRRAFADFIQGARGDLQLTQAMLGHARPSTTDAYLSGLSPEALSEAVKGLSIRPLQGVTSRGVAVREVQE